jgi:MoxR-like ATPase
MSDSESLVPEIEALSARMIEAQGSISRRFIGQEKVVELVLSSLICGGHALLIGLPGLGKTRLVETLSTVMGLDGRRIQFTPDLMPADILGSEVLETAEDGSRAFRFIEGPVFCQLLMADEINRASPRTQSALLQAMQEKSVTVAGHPHRDLAKPFHVLATQNPIEQEGTYPLPEAQLDRFLVQIDVEYPDRDTERDILMATTGSRRGRGQASLHRRRADRGAAAGAADAGGRCGGRADPRPRARLPPGRARGRGHRDRQCRLGPRTARGAGADADGAGPRAAARAALPPRPRT